MKVSQIVRYRILTSQKIRGLSTCSKFSQKVQPDVSNTQIVNNVPRNSLRKIFVAEMLIFTVFGFFDNFIMMIFGDQIEVFLGNHISHTMISAAIGNWMSDLFGLGTSERVENILKKVYPSPKLTAEEMGTKQFHNWKYCGRFTGITVGCLAGALMALPFIHDEEDEKN